MSLTKMSRIQDVLSILKALKIIAEAGVTLQQQNSKLLWRNSSFRLLLQKGLEDPKSHMPDVSLINLKESIDRVCTVVHGIKAYSAIQQGHSVQSGQENSQKVIHITKPTTDVKINHTNNTNSLNIDIKLSDGDLELLKKLDMEHRAKLVKEKDRKDLEDDAMIKNREDMEKLTVLPNPKAKLKLSENAKQRKVPSSRIGRMVSFGTLAAGLGLGTASEYAKRTLGISQSDPKDASTLFMTKANLDRIVDTLCKVRGAALKLGQIMSIQDDNIIHPDLAKALERVRKSADFMPDWQVEQMLTQELGYQWRENFLDFENRPFAAASIGQVHRGKTKDGVEVAVKIQYPGVAKGIESDIENLAAIMKMWNIFPKGMFLDNLMTVAKRELAWEVDYVREAECTKKFREILKPYREFYVPKVIDDLSANQVFTTELLDGIPVDQCFDMELEHREFIGKKILELCLREILQFRYMQTDPNWANFLYSPSKKQVQLLDFGATREYSREFMDKYVKILKAACDDDRMTVLNTSKEMGFLTGYESTVMEDAHVDAVMILGEIFRCKDKYDFARQDMTGRIQDLAQTMITHRLCPPPEEVYSLHRKLSGVFLLCTKLRVAVECKTVFLELYDNYVKTMQ
ncbi:unnamed protein product [Brassicogethes aeneus]|uniref:ABC1 atypical kinase-like domain-containing protein n=1 Tax=Brassicogethes aeneus TaxID=1431903 RepID=A0A9P0BD18_BRAAE|nr:unnamed protein product [Brassicogethes aeneus]